MGFIQTSEDRYWQHGVSGITQELHCLKKLGVNIETELSKAQTPFDVAEAFINLTDSAIIPSGTGAYRLLKNIWALFRRTTNVMSTVK